MRGTLSRRPGALSSALLAVAVLAVGPGSGAVAHAQTTPALVLSPTSIEMPESTGRKKYTVKLSTQPAGKVTVAVESADTTVATVNVSSLTFTTSDWDDKQTVWVSAVDDDIANAQSRTTRISHTASGAADYQGLSGQVAVSVINDDATGLFANRSSIAVDENGGELEISIRLRSEPTGEVTVALTTADTGIATVSPASVTFDNTNWESDVAVTVTGVDDAISNPNWHRRTSLQYGISGADYAGVTKTATPVIVYDNDPYSFGDVDEGAEGNYKLAMYVTPAGPFTVSVESSDTTVLTIATPTISVDATNSGQYQTFRFRAVEDAVTGDRTARIRHSVSPAGAWLISIPDFIVNVVNNDPASVTVAPTSFPEPLKVRSTTEYTVVLDTKPGADVTVSLTVGDPSIVAANVEELTFGPSNWDTPQTVTLTGAGTTGGDTSISHSASGGGYDDATIASVAVTVDRPPASGSGSGSPPNRAPVFDRIFPYELPENEDGRRRPFSLGALPVSDPDGDEVTCVLVAGELTLFTIEPESGALQYVGPGEDYETPPREYALTVRASDPRGMEVDAALLVMVTDVNELPTAGDDRAATAEDEPVVIDVLANDTDPDGDRLRVESVSTPDHGTTRLAADGGVSYTPEANYHGADRFRYVVSDGRGGKATAAVKVTVGSVNDAPEAEEDQVTTAEDTKVTVDVLANDSDPDGDHLRVVKVSAPTHGTARIATDGTVSYKPEANYHGADRFTYSIADPGGLRAMAAVEVMVLPVNDAPRAVGVIPDQTVDEGGDAVTVDVAPFFDDVEGDALIFRATSSDREVVTPSVAGTMLTLAPWVYGSALVTVTAQDPGGLTAVQRFAVGTSDEPVRAVLSETLAAMTRSHLASARMAVGRRVSLGRQGRRGSSLNVSGRSVPVSPQAARAAADGLASGWLARPGRSPQGAGGAAPGAWAAPAPQPRAAGRYPGGRVRTHAAVGQAGDGGSGWLLQGSDFVLAPGSPAGGEADASRRWQVWGQGDLQSFRGAPLPNSGYAGDRWNGWLGVDTWLTDHWLAGLALSHSGSSGDWRTGSAEGRITTSMTAAHPYLLWSSGKTSLWAMVGGGRGAATNRRDTNGREGNSGTELRLGLVELRRQIASAAGFRLGLRGDAAWGEMTTESGAESVDGLTAAVRQGRVGMELSRPLVTAGGLMLAPFGEAHFRMDAGDGQTGNGLELAGGVRMSGGLLSLETQGRLLVVHAAEETSERGVAATLRVGDSGGDGFSLALSPRWGDRASGTGALWQDHLYQRHAGIRADDWWFDARADYAMPLPGGQRLRWFGSWEQSYHGNRFQIGGRLDLAALENHRPD